jgi:hypothetical protein
MTNEEAQRIEAAIHRCLTEDFKIGRETNQAIFNPQHGWARFNGTDLDMVMEKVVSGIALARKMSEEQRRNGDA